MKIISLNQKNIEQEHICCAIVDKKNQEGVRLKKEWLKARFQEGLTFRKLDVRGKIFIEYLPAEYAWRPVNAPGYLFIHCLWVSGKYKGQGYAKELLNYCIADAEGTNGIAVVTSKKPFLTDKGFFLKHGFEVCDTAPPYFELLVRKNTDAPPPVFTESAKSLTTPNQNGIQIFYSDQCPFLNYYIDEMAKVAEEYGIPVQATKLHTAAEAQSMTTAYGTFNVFYNGKFLTHMPMSQKGFQKALEGIKPQKVKGAMLHNK